MSTRRPYPSDVNDDEWAFVAPYLTLLSATALHRKHDLQFITGSRGRGGRLWGNGEAQALPFLPDDDHNVI